jgi:hypothetical protein
MVARAGRVTVDVRSLDAGLQRPLLLQVVDAVALSGWECEVVIVADHELAALGYQIDLRKETRGAFEFHTSQRTDGAWVAVLSPKLG